MAGPDLELLTRYLDLVATWNRRINLTAAASPQARAVRLIGAVLPAVDLLEPGSLIDVGSGNGSPGLVLSLLRPDLRATLLEPRARRWAFLREAARAAGRPDIQVLRARHIDYPGLPAQNVTLRGLHLPLADLTGLVREGGQVLVWGRAPEAEVSFERCPGPMGGGTIHRVRRR